MNEANDITTEENEKTTLMMKKYSSDDPEVEDDVFIKPVCRKVIKKINVAKSESSTQKEEKECAKESGATCKELILKPDIISLSKIEKSPSQRIAEKEIPIPYKEPHWSGLPPEHYEFEVIKNGVPIQNIPLEKPYILVGRLSNCDIMLEHPSISRFHCVIQCRAVGNEDHMAGVYVHDLGSTHGTFQNKNRLLPHAFNQLKVGHILKFGGSTRLFILQGPDDDQEPESNFSVTELKAQANEKKLKLQKLISAETENNVSKTLKQKDPASEGIDWGMGDDADEEKEEEAEEIPNPFSSSEELFLNDPKKTLKGWLEREGYDLPDYQVEEMKPGHFKATLTLPISESSGKSMTCVVENKGKKKDIVIQCAMEACRALDRAGLLRQAVHDSREKKRKNWSENDYYDSDEDDFLDRTGDIERKRLLRKKELQASKGAAEVVETYQSLTKQYSEISVVLEKLEKNLKKVDELKNEQECISLDASAFSDADELEAYMNHLSSQLPDKHKRIEWKMEAIRLRKEEVRLRKLVNLTRPLGVPELPDKYSQYLDMKKENSLKPSITKYNCKKKAPTLLRVHEAFLDEEEEVKPKLRKLGSFDNDDDDNVRPVPYAKPEMNKKTLARKKYRELVTSKERKRNSLDPCSETEGEISKDFSTFTSSSCEKNLGVQREEEEELETRGLAITNEEDMEGSQAEDQKVDDVMECSLEEEYQTSRVIGPVLGPMEDVVEFAKPAAFDPPKTKGRLKSKGLGGDGKANNKSPFAFEEKYETWIPPKDQTGDGRTSLNDKFGY